MEKDGIQPTISIGVACYPEVVCGLWKLVSLADEALYRAKQRGKNCIAK